MVRRVASIAGGPISSPDLPTVGDQFDGSILLSVATGLPLIGTPLAVGAKVLGVETDLQIGVGSAVASSLLLRGLWPAASRAVWQFTMYRSMLAVGLYPTLGTSYAGIAGSGIGWRVPSWILVAAAAYYVEEGAFTRPLRGLAPKKVRKDPKSGGTGKSYGE